MRRDGSESMRRTRAWVLLAPMLVLVGVWVAGVNQGYPKTDTELYAALGLSAMTDGVWWRPSMGEAPYFNKPPLVMWIHGAVLAVLGDRAGMPSVWLMRLPVLVAGLGTIAFTVGAVRRLAGWRTALLTGAVLALTPEFFRYTHAISLDVWLALWWSGAVWCVVRGVRWARRVEVRSRGSGWWVMASGAPIGLALMTKPFIALLPWVLLGVWLVWVGRRDLVKWHIAGLGVALVIAAPWHIAMLVEFGDAFWHEYVGSQVIGRVATTAHGDQPWWYYPGVLARQYWPWLATGALGAVLWWKRRDDLRTRGLGALVALWCGAWVVLLSVAHDKSSRYIVGIYPLASVASAMLAIAARDRRVRRACSRAAFAAGPVVLIGGCIALAAGVRVHGPIPQDLRAVIDAVEARRAPIATTTPSRSLRATLYLAARSWPAVIHPDEPGDPAGPGILVIEQATRQRDEVVILGSLPADAEVVVANARFIAWVRRTP